jgi:hypothetical protein
LRARRRIAIGRYSRLQKSLQEAEGILLERNAHELFATMESNDIAHSTLQAVRNPVSQREKLSDCVVPLAMPEREWDRHGMQKFGPQSWRNQVQDVDLHKCCHSSVHSITATNRQLWWPLCTASRLRYRTIWEQLYDELGKPRITFPASLQSHRERLFEILRCFKIQKESVLLPVLVDIRSTCVIQLVNMKCSASPLDTSCWIGILQSCHVQASKHIEGAELVKLLNLAGSLPDEHCSGCVEGKSRMMPLPKGLTERPVPRGRPRKLHVDLSGRIEEGSVFHSYHYYLAGLTEFGFEELTGLVFKSQALLGFLKSGGSPEANNLSRAGCTPRRRSAL